MLPRLLTLLSIMVMVFGTHTGEEEGKTFNDGSGPEPEPEPEPEAEEEVVDGGNSTETNKTTAQDILPPIPQITFGWREAGIYGAGVLVGVSTTQAENIQNECISDVMGMIDASYNVYFYMDRYLENGKDINMAWAITYLIKLFERGAGLDCSNLETEIAEFFASLGTTQGWIDWINPLKDVAQGGTLVIRPEILEALQRRIEMPQLPEYPLYHVEPVVKQDEDVNTTLNMTTAIFDTVFEVLLDVEIIIASAEIYIGGSTAFTLFLDEQYFQSGFYTGSSSFGFWYVTRDIWIKWAEVWCANYGTTDTYSFC